MSFQDKLVKQFGRAPNANNPFAGEMDAFEKYKKKLVSHKCWQCGSPMYPIEHIAETNTTIWNCPARLCPNNQDNTLEEDGIRDLTQLNDLLPWNTDRLWESSINSRTSARANRLDDLDSIRHRF